MGHAENRDRVSERRAGHGDRPASQRASARLQSHVHANRMERRQRTMSTVHVVFGANPPRRRWRNPISQAVGVALTGISPQNLAFLFGPFGRNGKGLLMMLVSYVMGTTDETALAKTIQHSTDTNKVRHHPMVTALI